MVPYRETIRPARPMCKDATRSRTGVRIRPVRRLQDQDGTLPHGGGFGVRQRHFRRGDSKNYIAPVEKGIKDAGARCHLGPDFPWWTFE